MIAPIDHVVDGHLRHRRHDLGRRGLSRLRRHLRCRLYGERRLGRRHSFLHHRLVFEIPEVCEVAKAERLPSFVALADGHELGQRIARRDSAREERRPLEHVDAQRIQRLVVPREAAERVRVDPTEERVVRAVGEEELEVELDVHQVCTHASDVLDDLVEKAMAHLVAIGVALAP